MRAVVFGSRMRMMTAAKRFGLYSAFLAPSAIFFKSSLTWSETVLTTFWTIMLSPSVGCDGVIGTVADAEAAAAAVGPPGDGIVIDIDGGGGWEWSAREGIVASGVNGTFTSDGSGCCCCCCCCCGDGDRGCCCWGWCWAKTLCCAIVEATRETAGVCGGRTIAGGGSDAPSSSSSSYLSSS